MAISVVCGGCGRKGAIPQTLAGKRVKCPKCGASMPVPGSQPIGIVATKTCTACGIDVSGQKRTKDQHGRYFCAPCWSARLEERTARAPQVEAAVGSTIGLRDDDAGSNQWAGLLEPEELDSAATGEAVTCSACNTAVPQSEMTVDEHGQWLCRVCYDVQNPPFDLAAASFKPAAPIPLPPLSSAPTLARPSLLPRQPAVRTKTPGSGRSGVSQMAIGGLVCLAGSGATIAGYTSASQRSGGGRYTIFWGAIVFGAIGFFRGMGRMMSGE